MSVYCHYYEFFYTGLDLTADNDMFKWL